MLRLNRLYLFMLLLVSCAACQQGELKEITVQEFAEFIAATNYITDAEKFGWSIVQDDIYNFRTVDDINWRWPAGLAAAQAQQPVTQVSYNDALAFAKWSNAEIPSYEEYWMLSKSDHPANRILPNLSGRVISQTLPTTLETPTSNICRLFLLMAR